MTPEQELWRTSEAADYLSKVKGAQFRIQSLADQIADIYEEIAGIKAVDYSVDRVDGGCPAYIIEAMLDDKDERMKECQRQAHDLECLVRRVDYILGRMDDQLHASILEMHYVNGKPWDEIAEAVSYSSQHIYRLRFDALLCFYDCMFEKDTEIPDALES